MTCHGNVVRLYVIAVQPAEPQDPDGMMASVADFGLSRALALGQVGVSLFSTFKTDSCRRQAVGNIA